MWSSTVLLLTLVAGGPGRTGTPVQAYARVLELHVEDGLVDYQGLEARGLDALDRFLDAVATRPLPEGRDARIGWLIDAYNALVLRSVIRHGHPRSVLDVQGFFDRERHRVAGRSLTLDELEKSLLSPFADDPRTHFALVCAAKGCPSLETEPWSGSDIDRRLEAATRRYLRSPAGARVRAGELAISKIFDWYAKDFGGEKGARQFVIDRLPADRRDHLGQDPTLTFIDYDWSLNQE